MTSILPIILTGDNLGQRHRQINFLVNETFATNEDLKNILIIPEKSAVDRLFKIDLASKHRNVDYILQNLKDSDMLYVSRALKSKWLLEPQYQKIINPKNLEDNLYPHMVTTAVTKMKHWVHQNLNDKLRLEQFYKYYCEIEFELAMKFLVKSSSDVIKNKFPKIKHKISPQHFKRLCESCPQVAKIFFDSLASDENLKSCYMREEKNFFNSTKCVLKSDPNLYLDITEKYFDDNRFDRFSSIATEFIMINHKERFLRKPELYAAWILNLETLAENLTVEEAKELVLKLARAQYLQNWFDYKKVEPLIKRLKPEDRAVFKKKVFVQKDVGDKVNNWPYDTPAAPEIENVETDIFEDMRHEPYEYQRLGELSFMFKKRLCKKSAKYCSMESDCIMAMQCCERLKTMLDKLYDEYRFSGFEKTFYELQKRISAESSSQNRQYIMLVLVSKTAGRTDAIAKLMELLAGHNNEPPNLRAAVIRSLVKRASVWRLPEETWKKLLEFGQGLGLDGKPAEADCDEGLHSVVIRNFLEHGNCDDEIFKAYIDKFNDLSSYALTAAEKKCINVELPKMLLSAAKKATDVKSAVNLIDKLIDVFAAYRIKAVSYPGLISMVVELANKDYAASTDLLRKLYNNKVGRKLLFTFTYKLMKTSESHMNALKHNTSVLDFNTSITSRQFLCKLAIYFNENGGLALQYRDKLKKEEFTKYIGRSLAILLGDELESYLLKVDTEENDSSKQLAASIRANIHMARPNLDINAFGFRKGGAKMLANKFLTCPSIDINKNIKKLLEWKQTAKIALVLSKRIKKEHEVFISVAKLNPTVGIKMGIKLIKEHGDSIDAQVWETIKPLIQEINFHKDLPPYYTRKVIDDMDNMPSKIRPEYTIIIYKSFEKIEETNRYAKMPHLCRIEHILPDINVDFIEEILTKFLQNDFILDKITNNYDDVLCMCMYLRILFTYILLSKSEETEKHRFETFGLKVLERMKDIYNDNDKQKETFFTYLNEISLNFKNTKVFLNKEYVACLSVMEKTVTWMKTVLPMEQHFDKYAKIHLTMLYYKAVRQAAVQAPEVFQNERKLKEGVTVVANLFGKYVAKEVKELMEKYFESIIFPYKDSLVNYLDQYFNYMQSSRFLSSMIRGLLEDDDIRLGMYVFKEKYYNLKTEESAKINKSFGDVKDEKNKFFVFAEVMA